MKKLVPFKKEVEFNTEVAEITSISLEHTLQKVDDYFVSGNLVLTGEYKIVDVSVNTEKFNFTLPFEINIDKHYDTKELVIDIDDFYYELKESKMIVNITILLDHLEENEIEEEKPEILKREVEVEEEKPEILKREVEEKPITENKIQKEVREKVDIFSDLDSTQAYRTYKVYIVRENDTIEQIQEQFGVTKEDLENYNDLSSITVGLKLIIPTNNDEKI